MNLDQDALHDYLALSPRDRMIARLSGAAELIATADLELVREAPGGSSEFARLGDMSREALVALRKEIEEAVRASERQAKRQALEAARAAAAEHGFSLDEVLGGKTVPARGENKSVWVNPKNPDQKWTGRGRKPNWLVQTEAEAEAKQKEL